MKTVYIPKGETVHYESLATEHLVVHGRLHVTYGVKAQSITGSGVIDAGSINADTVCIDDVESGTVICKRLIAKRVQAPEVFASESAAVSCFLSAAYLIKSSSQSPAVMSQRPYGRYAQRDGYQDERYAAFFLSAGRCSSRGCQGLSRGIDVQTG